MTGSSDVNCSRQRNELESEGSGFSVPVYTFILPVASACSTGVETLSIDIVYIICQMNHT